MARSDTRYREAYNRLLDHCATLTPGADLPAEAALSEIAGVSRTVVRRCLARLAELGVIALDGRAKRVLRMPDQDDRIAVIRAADGLQALEQRFLDWILRFDVPAETPLSVAELARTFGVTQHQLNEFLAGLSRFGQQTSHLLVKAAPVERLCQRVHQHLVTHTGQFTLQTFDFLPAVHDLLGQCLRRSAHQGGARQGLTDLRREQRRILGGERLGQPGQLLAEGARALAGAVGVVGHSGHHALQLAGDVLNGPGASVRHILAVKLKHRGRAEPGFGRHGLGQRPHQGHVHACRKLIPNGE